MTDKNKEKESTKFVLNLQKQHRIVWKTLRKRYGNLSLVRKNQEMK